MKTNLIISKINIEVNRSQCILIPQGLTLFIFYNDAEDIASQHSSNFAMKGARKYKIQDAIVSLTSREA